MAQKVRDSISLINFKALMHHLKVKIRYMKAEQIVILFELPDQNIMFNHFRSTQITPTT